LKSESLLLLGAVGVGIYLLTKTPTATATDAYTTTGGMGATVSAPVPVPQAAQPVFVSSQTGAGAVVSQQIRSVRNGLDFINNSFNYGRTITSPGASLVGPNTTFSDNSGNTYHTDSNQSVQRLANGQVKVVTVQPMRPWW
jgi:hypothetical protein